MQYEISAVSAQMKYCRMFSKTADWKQEKTYSDHTLYVIADGIVAVQVNGRTAIAHPGDVIVLLSGDSTILTSPTGCTFLAAFFSLDAGNYPDLLRQANCAGLYDSSLIAPQVHALLHSFSGEGRSALMFSLEQYGMLLNLLSRILECVDSRTPFYEETREYAAHKLAQLTDLMEASVPAMLPIRDLAAIMGMSEKYFLQYFRREIGCSPGTFMNRQRMNYAARLLYDDSLSLDDVAQKMLFSDRYAFSKAFRKYYGEAPGAFRSHLKKG